MAEFARRLDVFEILEKTEKVTTRAEKIAVLQKEACTALKDVLRGCFDDSIEWDLPKGEVPYTPNRPESTPTTLLKQHKNFHYFVKDCPSGKDILKMRKEKMFINMLEGVHPKDAIILVAMINKKSPTKGITKKLVQETFPGLLVK
jgi:Family of unknown function (DUF6433)